jgi:hypothetical protein
MRASLELEILSEAAVALTAPETDLETIEHVTGPWREPQCRARGPPGRRTGRHRPSRPLGRLELAFLSVLSDCAGSRWPRSALPGGRSIGTVSASSPSGRRRRLLARTALAVAAFEVEGWRWGSA